MSLDLTMAWGANCDYGPLLTRGDPASDDPADLKQFWKIAQYIAAYACKGAGDSAAAAELGRADVEDYVQKYPERGA